MRYELAEKLVPLRSLPAAALRAVLREGYGTADFRRDVLAGTVVGIVALPLSLALGIAVGVPPQQGLYTAIVAGFLVALLGGSRTQVTGPTAAFVVILAPITVKFGVGGLLLAGFLAGLILLALGLLRLGSLIEFVPHPVTTGFTAGIGTVIALLQLKDVFGLAPEGRSDHLVDRLGDLWRARGTASLAEAGIAATTLALLLLLPRVAKRVPAPLVALPLVALVVWALRRWAPGFDADTIASRFTTEVDGELVRGIPRVPPLPMLPWHAPGPDGQPLVLSFALVRELFPSAFAIAMLGAIESLLSALVADGMARTRHDPDAELFALGVGNLIAPFFGGIPATGAIARTATNIRSGGRTPVAAMTHAVVVIAAVLVLAPLIGELPMASLAALLLLVAWNMSEVRHFRHMLRVAPKSDIAVLVTCYALTVLFDMVVSVSVGIVLAALLFMRRMAEVTQARLLEGAHHALPRPLPAGVLVYDIEGPLFFGAAQKAMATLGEIAGRTRVVILRMESVPAMDATGLVAFESALAELDRHRVFAVVSGLRPQPARVFEKGGITDRPGRLAIVPHITAALEAAEAETRAAA